MGTNAAAARAGKEILIGFRIAHHFDGAAKAHLLALGFPVEIGGRHSVCQQFGALLTFEIGEEDDAALVPAAHQHHAHIGHAIRIDRRNRHGGRIIGLARLGQLQPFAELREGLAALGHFPRICHRTTFLLTHLPVFSLPFLNLKSANWGIAFSKVSRGAAHA